MNTNFENNYTLLVFYHCIIIQKWVSLLHKYTIKEPIYKTHQITI